jgi:uncharacterized membrane-anchored protein
MGTQLEVDTVKRYKHMKFRLLMSSKDWAYSTVNYLIPILVASFCLQQQCLAQQQFASPDASVDPLKYVNWISGPQKITLGDVADINIPQGYRFTDVHGARMILVSLNNPIPDELVGILVPNSGKWMALLQYSPRGYVKNPNVTQVNTTAVLKKALDQINEKEGKSSVAFLGWQSQPVYDAQNHMLEWSLQVGTPSSVKVLNQTAVLMGRHGILEMTVAQPSSVTGVPIDQLISNISFKDGERYADYQKGDKTAEIGLAELISGAKQTQTAGFFSGFGAIAAWIYCGLGVCLVGGGVIVILRRGKTQPHPQVQAQIPVPSVQKIAPVNSVSSNPPSPIVKKVETNGHAQPKPVSPHANGSRPFQRNRRKRVFDYPKFYTNVMRELSLYSCGPGIVSNGKPYANGHTNGHTNGNSNGHANGHSNGHAAPTPANGTKTNGTIKTEIEDLIAVQKSLIQEQKCLLEQQTRLIEEKRWLIEEQTAFLKNQAGLTADPQQVPLKFE